MITKAMEDLVMDPEDNKNTGSTEEDNKIVNGSGSLTIDLKPGTNNNINEQ